MSEAGREAPVAGLVLAAGLGTRFGAQSKMLAQDEGEAFVRRAVRAAREGGLSPILVVTGYRAEEIEAALAGEGATFVPNPAFREGMSSSVKAGFAALPREAPAALVLLGDMPRVSGALVRRLVSAWRAAGRPPALVPSHGGKRGNPVLLSRALAPRIAALAGDKGAGPILNGLDGLVELPVEDPAILLDVDTAEAYGRLAAGAPRADGS